MEEEVLTEEQEKAVAALRAWVDARMAEYMRRVWETGSVSFPAPVAEGDHL